MIIIGMLLPIAAIGFFCWLLFTLAVYALPLLAGVSATILAYRIGAGLLGAMLFGLIAAGLALGLGRFLFEAVKAVWARNLIALAFVLPATVAGYHAVHGIAVFTMPSPIWQVTFSIGGAIAVGATAFARIAAVAPAGPSPGNR